MAASNSRSVATLVLVICCCLPAALSARPARALLQTTNTLDLKATLTTSGTSPAIIGVNVGHRYPGSNWPIWLRRLGVNGARVFTTATWGSKLNSATWTGTTNWGKSLSGVTVVDQTTFEAAVAELRTTAGHTPSSAASWAFPVKWSKFDSKFNTTVTSAPADEQEGNHDATLATVSSTLPNNALVVISLGLSSIGQDASVLDTATAAYWSKSWEVYKHIYAFSRYLWVRNITRLELYNEPDLDSNFDLTTTTFNIPLWVDTYKLRSRAIQNLYSDMNAETGGADLTPNINVGAFAKTTYDGGNLGQPSVQARRGTFPTGDNAAWSNLNTYSYHSYGQGGASILSNFNGLLTSSSADRVTYGALPFAVTEYNAKTSGDFSTSALNMDSPDQAVKFGSQTINYATAGADLQSIFAFKFSVTLSSGNGVTKNGIHWGDNIGAQYHISDTALGAEALRLVADKVAGGKPLYSFTSTQASKLPDTKAIAVKDTAFNTYYINAVNTGANDARVALGMAAWGVKSGWPVIVERVNAVNYGEVTEILAANSTGGVFVPLQKDNLVRVTVPAVATTLTNAIATVGLNVRANSLQAVNYASSPKMCVASSTATHDSTQASIMKFAVTSPATVKAAVLKLTLSTISADLTSNMPMLLLGISDNGLAASTATWSTLSAAAGPLLPHPPVGASASWAFDTVNKTFINWGSPGMQVVGHITLPTGLKATAAPNLVRMVDVTPFVRASSGTVSFVLVRPFRRNTETATGDVMPADTLNAGTSACWFSALSTNAAKRPTLSVYA